MGAGEGGGFAADNAEGARAMREVSVNEKAVSVPSPVALGQQIRSAAGLVPEENWVLIRLIPDGTRSIGLDEPVDMRHGGVTSFRAFENDRVYSFTLAGRGYEWGAPSIGEEELRSIAGIADTDVLVLERKGHGGIELADGAEINLDGAGVERLVTRKGVVEVFLDDESKKIPRGVYTTEELIGVLGVEPGYVLDLKTPDGRLEPLQPGEKTRVRKGMHFISHAPCGGSS